MITGLNSFTPSQIFDCGQAFRFYKEADDSYTGVAFERVINVSSTPQGVLIKNTNKNDMEQIWINYFDLNRNYDDIKRYLREDEVMCRAIAHGDGIRVLRQDKWETLITFILSQRNNIPRIKGLVQAICQQFGKRLSYNEKTYYTFPTPQALASHSLDDLAALRSGYRGAYLYEAAKRIAGGEFLLDDLDALSTQDAQKLLLTLKGVGVKVSDCVLLFGYGKLDAFPVDVWMERVIGTLYDKASFRPEIFGEYCGIAQQYLFYFGRENNIGKTHT